MDNEHLSWSGTLVRTSSSSFSAFSTLGTVLMLNFTTNLSVLFEKGVISFDFDGFPEDKTFSYIKDVVSSAGDKGS